MNYEGILKQLGYVLIDMGNYWHTSGLYREGKSGRAIQIYKNSGVWRDFASSGTPLPFEVLLRKTLKTEDISDLKLDINNREIFKKRELLSEEKIYPENCLGKLLPDYTFFKQKNKDKPILESTQIAYGCGLATNGKLFNRIVFPIRNRDKKIHGFSGRTVLSDPKYVKWLHYGKSRDWFYPYYSVEGAEEAIFERKRVFVVESIGDSMSLFQAGFPENIVAFTNRISSQLTSKLSNLGVNIYLSLNNDKRGLEGGISSLFKLYETVDFNRLWFLPSPDEGTDFGDLKDEEIKIFLDSGFYEESHKDNSLNFIRLIEKTPDLLPENLRGKYKKFKKEWEYNYE